MDMTAISSHSNPEKVSLDTTARKFQGFDFLRAIFSLAVVGYKTNLFYLPAVLLPGLWTQNLGDYFLSGMFGALAVPSFLQISLFLYSYKSANKGLSYFLQKRLPRLISLYVFWVGSITLFDILFVGGFEKVSYALSSPKALAEFIVGGNSTPYFFFFALIFLTIASEFFLLLLNRLNSPAIRITISYIFLFVACTALFLFSTIDYMVNSVGLQSPLLETLNNIAKWDYTPTNFLPYVFTAAITAQEYHQGKLDKPTKFLKRKLIVLLTLALLFFSLEWTLTSRQFLIQVDQAPLDHYLRVSLIFGSWFLLYLGILSKRSVPPVIQFLSDCSLGIYGFHVFFIFGRLPLGDRLQTFPALYIIGNFSIALLGAILLTLIAKRIKILRQFV